MRRRQDKTNIEKQEMADKNNQFVENRAIPENLPPSYHITPHQIVSEHFNKFLCVTGIISKTETKKFRQTKTSFTTLRSFTVQDALENSKEQIPETVQCLLETTPAEEKTQDFEGDLVAGRKLKVWGVLYSDFPAKSNGVGIVKKVFYVKKYKMLNKIHRIGCLQENVLKRIFQEIFDAHSGFDPKDPQFQKDIVSYLANSMAPSIKGHFLIKKALLLQQVGGLERNLDTGTHIRGNVNLLLTGDPSTAKSQFLRFISKLAPNGVLTSGRSSSAAGLTAAVISENGEYTIAPGALVVSDGSTCCIDEFDKINENDRVSLHEAMEQQTVTINKAGVHYSLNARACVLAAANPIHSKYDPNLSIRRNINLPDSLLSRFDLIFLVLDNLEDDDGVARHVLDMHEMAGKIAKDKGEHAKSDSNVFNLLESDDPNQKEDDEDEIDKKNSELLKKINLSTLKKNEKIDMGEIEDKKIFFSFQDRFKNMINVIKVDPLKQYISLAKSLKPELTEAALKMIQDNFITLRKNDTRATPVTPRSLESMLRLSTAHAKARLSTVVEELDVEATFELFNNSTDVAPNSFGSKLRMLKLKNAKNEENKENMDEDKEETTELNNNNPKKRKERSTKIDETENEESGTKKRKLEI